MSEASGSWVPYGVTAATALRERLSALKASEPLRPVSVVVDSNQVGVSIRRQLASGSVGPVCGAGPGLIAVSFLTPYRLAELLGASILAAEGRRPVSTPILAAAARSALAADPGSFGPVAGHPATEAALVAAYRELRDVSGGALDRLAAAGARTAEVVRIHRATRRLLVDQFYDEEDLMDAATRAVSDHGARHEIGAVVLYLPQRLSRHAAAMVRATDPGSLHVIAGCTGDARADAEVVASVERLGISLGPIPALVPAVDAATTRIVTASDPDDEVRTAVRQVVDAVTDGQSLDRIAVLHAASEPYALLLHDHFEAAGITTNGASTVPVAGRLASRALLGLLELPASDFRRQDVFTWITGAPLIDGDRPVPTSSWERISRRAGIVGGRSEWDHLLEHLARRSENEAQVIEASNDQAPWRAERLREDAVRARSLRSFVLGLIRRLDQAVAPATWGDRAAWAKTVLADLLGPASRRDRWPDPERRAADRLELALDRLTSLDAVEGPVDLDVFTRTLTVELEADLGRSGRFGEGVLVGPVALGVGVDLDLVILVGMAEGSFPATQRPDSLLPDEDRAATGGELPLRQAGTDRLHRQFLATVRGARSQVLCVPKGDLRRSRDRVPSRWVLDVASTLAGESWWSDDLLAGDQPWLAHSPSFDAGLRNLRTPATEQEHRLRRLLALAQDRRDLAASASGIDQRFASGVEVLDARRSDQVTRFDGNLAGLPIPSPIDVGTSATRLEAWAACPHKYLMAHVLRVEPVEQPEDSLQITPLDRGNLVHEALERLVLESLERDGGPAPAEPWSPNDHQRLGAIGSELCEALESSGLTGRRLFWQRDKRQILADLDRFLYEDDQRRAATGARPLAAELAFGFGGVEPVRFPLDDGRSVPVRGKADRVDVGADGTLFVVDYKTGSNWRYTKLSSADPHQNGRHLQLAVYGRAARLHAGTAQAPVRADYWFTSARYKFDRRGYDVTDDVMASVGHAMTAIVGGIEAGLFPAHPGPRNTSGFVDCHDCDPDGLGTTELTRQWEKKMADPAVAAYVDLLHPAEPETVDP